MKLKEKNGILYPSKMAFGSWIVLGPPGSGKSGLIKRIGGYPGEICIDISEKKWWTVQPLVHRPREIHFAFPFRGFDEGLAVYEVESPADGDYPKLEYERIQIPLKKKFILAPNWRARFVFDFILPPAGWLLENRQRRLEGEERRLVDLHLNPELVRWQVETHWRIAHHFYQSGLQVMLRPFSNARPYSLPVLRKIVQKVNEPARGAIAPNLNWSKVEWIKRWIDEVSPQGSTIAPPPGREKGH